MIDKGYIGRLILGGKAVIMLAAAWLYMVWLTGQIKTKA